MKMSKFKFIFYINKVPVENGEVILDAIDAMQAEQALLLKLNSDTQHTCIPSIWDTFSLPIEMV
jgi:hypothetical protein